jgi:hypothetical protein
MVVLSLRGDNRSFIREVRLNGIVHLLLAHRAVLYQRRIALDIQLGFHLRRFSAVDLGISCFYIRLGA